MDLNLKDLMEEDNIQIPEIEILQKKVADLLAKREDGNQAVFEKIDKDNKLLEDYILNLGKGANLEFMANGKMYMNFDTSTVIDETNNIAFEIHENALFQLGDRFDIPRKYVRNLYSSEWGRKLLQNTLTEHMHNTDRKRILVRTVGEEVRGILSDKYRRLNSNEIYEAFIKGCRDASAVIYEAYYTDIKTYISAIIPKVYKIQTLNNGDVYAVFGAKIANSDFGKGALDVRAFMINVTCLNGMVSDTKLKQVHLGKRLSDDISFSEETYILDTQTMASATADIMKMILGEERILQTVNSIMNASREVINLEAEMIRLPKIGYSKAEVEQINTKLINNDPATGVTGLPTRWKLSQAITSVAQDIGEERQHELDELAGKIAKL